jgi:hypothetical protein
MRDLCEGHKTDFLNYEGHEEHEERTKVLLQLRQFCEQLKFKFSTCLSNKFARRISNLDFCQQNRQS